MSKSSEGQAIVQTAKASRGTSCPVLSPWTARVAAPAISLGLAAGLGWAIVPRILANYGATETPQALDAPQTDALKSPERKMATAVPQSESPVPTTLANTSSPAVIVDVPSAEKTSAHDADVASTTVSSQGRRSGGAQATQLHTRHDIEQLALKGAGSAPTQTPEAKGRVVPLQTIPRPASQTVKAAEPHVPAYEPHITEAPILIYRTAPPVNYGTPFRFGGGFGGYRGGFGGVQSRFSGAVHGGFGGGHR
jgi:hypothetical protein